MVVTFSKVEKDNFDIFCKFFWNLVSKHQRSLDWPSTLRNKRFSIQFQYNEIINQIRITEEEFNKVTTHGHASGIESEILLVKFQQFTNTIYSLCENFTYISSILHNNKGYSHSLPAKFSQQQGFYSKIDATSELYDYCRVIDSINIWYKNVHAIRSESTHYLNGFVYINESKAIGILYQNFIRYSESDEIKIENLEEYVSEILRNTESFIVAYGDYMIRFLDDDFVSGELCGSTQPFQMYGQREYTYKVYREDLPGRCYHAFNCPHTSHCQAYAAKQQ